MSQKPVVLLKSANDNQPKRAKQDPRIIEEWPEELPITCAELDLLELYLGDIVMGIAANDNVPS